MPGHRSAQESQGGAFAHAKPMLPVQSRTYREVLELAPSPHYDAYANLGILLCEAETRCEEALPVFDGALQHFLDDALLQFNRAVVPEELKRYDAAETAYQRCIALDPTALASEASDEMPLRGVAKPGAFVRGSLGVAEVGAVRPPTSLGAVGPAIHTASNRPR